MFCCGNIFRVQLINTLRPRQNGLHFAGDTFKPISLKENVRISIKISLKFVHKSPIDNIPALFQIMAWRRPGDKPLSEAMMVSLLTHICVARSQWVNMIYWSVPASIKHFHTITASDIAWYPMVYPQLNMCTCITVDINSHLHVVGNACKVVNKTVSMQSSHMIFAKLCLLKIRQPDIPFHINPLIKKSHSVHPNNFAHYFSFAVQQINDL